MDPEKERQTLELAEKLLAEQNFGAAAIAGVVTMLLAAGVYGVVKSLSEGFYYSILAAGIGIAIGLAMQFLGRGIDRKFAVAAALFALAGCMLGNMFAVVMHIARASQVSPFSVLLDTPAAEAYGWMFEGLPLADLMFWLIGIGSAAYFARRSLTREEAFALHTYARSGLNRGSARPASGSPSSRK